MSTATMQPPARTTRRDILEYAASGAAHHIDRGRGLIHDVKILGTRSRNGGMYPPAAMSNARPLYEGARVNIDHPERSNPDQERGFGEWFGVLENVRQLADGLYGDLAYLTSHPLAAQVCEAAERFPGNFGMSHNAQVTEAAHEGQVVYEAIHRVRSVDIVCKPATTRGIFESEVLSMSSNKSVNVLCDDPASNAPAGFDPMTAAIHGSADGDDSAQTASSTSSSVDWDAFVARLQDIYDGPGTPATRIRQAVELVCRTFENADGAADPTGSGTLAPVSESTRNDRTNRGGNGGRAGNGKLESARPSLQPAAARADGIRPRSAGGTAENAAGGQATKASKWDDPRLAALALLSH